MDLDAGKTVKQVSRQVREPHTKTQTNPGLSQGVRPVRGKKMGSPGRRESLTYSRTRTGKEPTGTEELQDRMEGRREERKERKMKVKNICKVKPFMKVPNPRPKRLPKASPPNIITFDVKI